MKKLISLFLCVISLCLLMSISAGAVVTNGTLSDDLQTFTLDGVTYKRINALACNYYGYDPTVQLDISTEMSASVSSAVAYLDSSSALATVDVLYQDGALLSIGFIRESDLQQYHRLYEAKSGTCTVDTYMGRESLQLEKLKTDPMTLQSIATYWADTYMVEMWSEDDAFSVIKGTLLIDGDEYYYADHEELGIVNRRDFYADEYTTLEVYHITDPQTIKELDDHFAGSNDIGLMGSDLTEVVSAVLLIFVFAVVPAIALVLSLILAIRFKGFYKLAWGVVCGLCAAEILVVILIILIL